MAIIYPYSSIKNESGRSHHGPYVPIYINHPDGKLLVFLALIDSGADSCVMSKSTAEFLKLKLGKTDKTGGIGGDTKGRWSNFSFKIIGEHEQHSCNDVPVFVLEQDLDVAVLLGRNPFFHDFDVSFINNSKIKLIRKSRSY